MFLFFLLFSIGLNIIDRDLDQYQIAVPLIAPNKGTTILY